MEYAPRIIALEDALKMEQSRRADAVLDVLQKLSDTDKRLVAQDALLMQKLNNAVVQQQAITTTTSQPPPTMVDQEARATLSTLSQAVNTLNQLPARVGKLEQLPDRVSGLEQAYGRLDQTKLNKVDMESVRQRLDKVEGDGRTVSGNVAMLQQGKLDRTAGDTLQTRLGSLTSDYNTFKAQTQGQMQDHTNRIADLQKQSSASYASLQSKVDGYVTDTSAQLGVLGSLRTNMDSLNTWRGSVDSRVGALQQAGQDYVGFKSSASSDLASMKGRVDTLNSTVATLSQQQATLMNNLKPTGNSTVSAASVSAAVADLQGKLGASFDTRNANVSDALRVPGGATWTANGISLPNSSGAVLRMNAADGSTRHVFDASGGSAHAGTVRVLNGGCLELGADVRKDGDAGKLCYNANGGVLDMTGAGTSATGRKVRLRDEVESGKFSVGSAYYMGPLDGDGLVRFKRVDNNGALGVAGSSAAFAGPVSVGDLNVSGTIRVGGVDARVALKGDRGPPGEKGATGDRGPQGPPGDSAITTHINGKDTLEFGSGIAGKDADAGKIGYQALTNDLDIVGAGDTVGWRNVRVHDNLSVNGWMGVGSGGIASAGDITAQSKLVVGQGLKARDGNWVKVLGDKALTTAPSSWAGGGLHAANLYAEGTIGVGANGNAARFFNKDGDNMQQSDARVKDNVRSISSEDAALVRALRPVTYTRKHDADKRMKYGFIAQEVQRAYPALVSSPLQKDGLLAVNYEGMIPLVTASVQDAHRRLDAMQQATNNSSRQTQPQLCIDGTCITKQELVKLKQLLG